MKFSEAMKLLEEGKKVKCVYWREGTYIQLKGDVIYDDEGETYEIPGLIIEEDWEEYIEPETKKIEKLNENDLFITLDGITKLEPMKASMRMLDKINEIIDKLNELEG